MAKVEVSVDILEDLLFGYSDNPVSIVGVAFDFDRESLMLDINGQDVPDCEEVRARVTVRSNRRGEKFHTMEFKPA